MAIFYLCIFENDYIPLNYLSFSTCQPFLTQFPFYLSGHLAPENTFIVNSEKNNEMFYTPQCFFFKSLQYQDTRNTMLKTISASSSFVNGSIW